MSCQNKSSPECHLLLLGPTLFVHVPFTEGFPGGASGKEPTCQCRRLKRHGFNPCVWKIPWRKWKPTPVFLPVEIPWSLVGYSPWSRKESDKTEATWHTIYWTSTKPCARLWGQRREWNIVHAFKEISDWSRKTDMESDSHNSERQGFWYEFPECYTKAEVYLSLLCTSRKTSWKRWLLEPK